MKHILTQLKFEGKITDFIIKGRRIWISINNLPYIIDASNVPFYKGFGVTYENDMMKLGVANHSNLEILIEELERYCSPSWLKNELYIPNEWFPGFNQRDIKQVFESMENKIKEINQ